MVLISPLSFTTMSQTDSAMVIETSVPKTPRVLSIDALRGFDMFWIIGADELAKNILKKGDWPFSPTLVGQFTHADWEGFRFYDLIFPLFLFLVGCVLPYSLDKYRGQASQVYGRIFRRTLLLIVLGLIYSGMLKFDFANLRYAGVLQRIALCYCFASLLYLHLSWKGRIAAFVGILLGYWAILSWIPVPGGVAGDLTKEGNLSGYLDRTLLPGKILALYYGHGDNEGILSTLPAIGTALLGVFAGEWLRSRYSPYAKAGGLAIAGVACVLLGTLWGLWFPVIKNLWTSSFVLVAGGWSLLLLSLFYFVIDVQGWKKWAFFWTVLGMNAITIYMVKNIVDFSKISKYFLTGVANLFGEWQTVILQAGTLGAMWLFLYYLYRQKLFLRV